MRRGKIVLVLFALALGAAAATWFALPEPWARLMIRLESARAEVSRGSTVVDGRTWRYFERAGPNGEPPLVMIHGFGAAADNFVRFAGKLPGWPILAVDLPGFGVSDDAADGKYGVSAQAERLHAFLAARGVSRYHLAGNSMGGAIAARLAHDHPDEVVTLLLLEPFGLGGLPKSDRDRLLERGENVLIPRTRAEYDRLIDVIFVQRPYIPGPLLKMVSARFLARADQLQDIWLQLQADTGFLEPLLPAIPAPTLVVWGDSNRIFDLSGAERIARGVPHGRAVVLAHCGHAPMLEQPAETAAEYRKLLRP